MIFQKCDLNLNRDRRELQPHGTPDFPCAAFSLEYTGSVKNEIPWHWHEEMEVIYIKKGALRLMVPGNTLYLKKGEGIFINSKILHYAEAQDYCVIHSLVFHPSLIGADNSIFAQKYIYPLTNVQGLAYCLFSSDNRWLMEMTNCIIKAFEAMLNKPLGYEFAVRENLSHLCLSLYQQYAAEISENIIEPDHDTLRLRKMMDFIHAHYTENPSLSHIAKAGTIGERECLRCFRRAIQISPMQYLLKYRITQGASMLLSNRSSSISEISRLCGFDSPSNFSQMFKRFYRCTPREYRQGVKL